MSIDRTFHLSSRGGDLYLCIIHCVHLIYMVYAFMQEPHGMMRKGVTMSEREPAEMLIRYSPAARYPHSARLPRLPLSQLLSYQQFLSYAIRLAMQDLHV